MKLKKMIWVYFCYFFIYFLSIQGEININNKNKEISEASIVIALMVKDEEKVVVETLKPFVEAGLHSIFLYDTGSNDKTIEKAKSYFKNNRVNKAVICEEPFIDFSTSRNKALDLIENKYFPDASFILMLDAEWYIHNPNILKSFCAAHINDDPQKSPCYDIKIKASGCEFYVTRLIKGKSNCRFHGRVHETLNKSPVSRVISDTFFEYTPKQEGAEKTRKRWLRDKELLLKDHADDPKNLRTLYYLAQTHFDLHDFENAAKYFKLFTKQDPYRNSEYSFMAWYNLGKCIDEIHRINKNINWDKKGLIYYHNAHKIFPERVEPLVRIANHYLEMQNWSLGYMYAKFACDMGNLKNEYIWIEKNLYDFNRYDILGMLAWHVEEYEIGEWSVKKAIEAQPEKEYLKNNLNIYINRKKQ